MTWNVGGIYVRTKDGVDAIATKDAIVSYRLSRGARLLKRMPPLEPLGLEATGRLGYAVLPEHAGWIAVSDSERYTADFALAQHLATALGTSVYWYALYGATSGGVQRMLGSAEQATPEDDYDSVEAYVAATFTPAFVYFGDIPTDRSLSIHRFAFSHVNGYDTGPDPGDASPDSEDERRDVQAATVAHRPPIDTLVPRELVASEVLQRGFLVAFFLRGPFPEHAAHVRALFDAWLEVVPKSALQSALVGENADEAKPFTSRVVGRCHAQLEITKPGKIPFFEVGGPEMYNRSWEFRVYGETEYDPTAGHASSVQVRFPHDASTEDVVRFAMRAAQALSYSTGFVSPTLMLGADSTHREATDWLVRLAVRHPGLEVNDDRFSYWLSDRCHGAHWLVFLGPSQVTALGGANALREAVGEGVSLEPAGQEGALMLRTSAEPLLGDLLAGDDLPVLRRVDRALRPIVHVNQIRSSVMSLHDVGWIARAGGDPTGELRERWLSRFHEDSEGLTATARMLEPVTACEALVASLLDGKHPVDGGARLAAALAPLTLLSYVLQRALAKLVLLWFREGRLADGERLLGTLSVMLFLHGLIYDDDYFESFKQEGDAPRFIDWFIGQVPAASPASSRESISLSLARFGAHAVDVDPSVAGTIVRHLSAGAAKSDWQTFLRAVNNKLVGLCETDEAAAERLADDVQSVASHNPYIFHAAACVYVRRNRMDDALRQVELAAKHRYEKLSLLKTDKDLRPIRDDPRFAAALRS